VICDKNQEVLFANRDDKVKQIERAVQKMRDQMEDDAKALVDARVASEKAEKNVKEMVKGEPDPVMAILAMVASNVVAQENNRIWLSAKETLARAHASHRRSEAVYHSFHQGQLLLTALMDYARARNEVRANERAQWIEEKMAMTEQQLNEALKELGGRFQEVCGFLLEGRKYQQCQRRDQKKNLDDYKKYMDEMADSAQLQQLSQNLEQAKKALEMTDQRTEWVKTTMRQLWVKLEHLFGLLPQAVAEEKRVHFAKVLYDSVGPMPDFLELLPADCKQRSGHAAKMATLVKVKEEIRSPNKGSADPPNKQQNEAEPEFHDASETMIVVEEMKAMPEIQVIEVKDDQPVIDGHRAEGHDDDQSGCIIF